MFRNTFVCVSFFLRSWNTFIIHNVKRDTIPIKEYKFEIVEFRFQWLLCIIVVNGAFFFFLFYLLVLESNHFEFWFSKYLNYLYYPLPNLEALKKGDSMLIWSNRLFWFYIEKIPFICTDLCWRGIFDLFIFYV